ncbi:MAG: alkaline phosphatase family protein [Balneolales bacterium]
MRKLICIILLTVSLTPAYGQQPVITENVFLISLDGLRWQELYTGADPLLIAHEDYVNDAERLEATFWDDDAAVRREKLMPFFWNVIARQGQLYGNRAYGNNVDVTNGLNFSYPGYSELLTGFVDEGITSNQKRWNPNKTVLEFVNDQPGFEGHVAAFGSWDVFPYIVNSERSGIPVNAGFEGVTGENLTERERFLNELLGQIPSPWGSVRLDAFTHHYALEHFKKYAPRLIYIAYGETDDFAHNGNYQAYLYSARQTDSFIEDLWNTVQSTPGYRNKTTFIITTDHGRGTVPVDQWRGHGSNVEGSEEMWIAVIGPDTPARGVVREPMQLYQNQIARTLAHLLGLDYRNDRQVGGVIPSMFSD